MICKEVFLTPAMLKECRRIVALSDIMKEDDNNWPEPNRVGRQELEIVMGNEHISFTMSKIGSLMDVQTSKDPKDLRIFYYLVQDHGRCPVTYLDDVVAVKTGMLFIQLCDKILISIWHFNNF